MSDQSDARIILELAGEGGGLDLYCVEKDGTLRFAWDPIWQMPGEDGQEPTKTVGWKAKQYMSVTDAVDAAPKYWLSLMPVFVRADFRDFFWNLASARLAESGRPPEFIRRCLGRWERACQGPVGGHEESSDY
jgi:hypothetical protein